MGKFFAIIFIALTGYHTSVAGKKVDLFISEKYDLINFDQKPEFDIFRHAMLGYMHLESKGKLSDKNLLTIIDFSKSSNEKRLWIINMESNEVVYHNLVSHGRNTGNEFAEKFSNIPNSNMSSLGFYVTGENYTGKHGLSLRLDGMEPGFNDNARDRAIVIHSAEYATAGFARTYGRLGRSLGCPAIPVDGHETVMKMLSGKTCLFIYFPDQNYLKGTKLLDSDSFEEDYFVGK